MRLLSLLTLLPALALAQGIPLKSGAGSDLATVDTAKNLRVSPGASTRPTYRCSATGLATTALYSMQIHAPAATGFKLAKICIGTSAATAAALQTVTVQRRTTAAAAGTAATAEGTASPAVSKMDPASGNFAGVCNITGTLGTAGAVLDGYGWTVPEIGAGAADPGTGFAQCYEYGDDGARQMPVVLSGITNGISIVVSAAGAGGLASGSITATFIVE